MQETVNERIRLIAEKLYKNNVNELCRALGIKQATMSNIVAGRMSKPSFEVLLAIVEKSNISADWLITGRGEMLNNINTGQNFGSIGGNNKSSYNNIGNTLSTDPNIVSQHSTMLENEITQLKLILEGKDELIKSQSETIAILKDALSLRKTI